MKKIYTLLILAGICLQFSLLAAQEQRIVRVAGWDPASGEPVENYIDAVLIAINADEDAREQNPNVIYELERGKIYPFASRITPRFDLHIRGEAGDGPLPVMQNWPTATGSYNDFFRSQNNFTLEYVHVDGYDQEGGVGNRNLKHYGEGNRIIYRGVIIDGDRGAAIAIYDNDTKLYIYDCVVGNQGHRRTIGGNGRLIDIRPTETQDTIVIKNTTVYNYSDRVIRNMGTVVNYIEVDHLTAFNILGFHGTLQLGQAKNAIVTNSVFANSQLFGDHTFIEEQTQPEKSFFVVTLDTIYEGGTYVLRNNNIFWDQEVLDTWAAIDTVNVPGFANPTLLTAAGTTLEQAFISEHLNLANVCAPPVDFIVAYYADPTASEFPENWCVGWDETGIFPEDIDVSYNSQSMSFTAADLGYPLGDLNAYPELKARWEQGEDIRPPQEQRIVKVAGWDPASGEPIENYIDAVLIAINADADAREQNSNVIYELERGKIYPFASRITPRFDLHIRSEAGDGPLPVMQNWPTTTGSYNDFFRSQNNFTLEYVHVDGYDQEGGVGNRNLKHYGVGNRIIYRGCIIDGDRGAAIAIFDNDMKLYIYDVIAGNQGHRKTIGGNGRLVDIRPSERQDTIVIKNTTTYNYSDRVLRNMGTVVNYIEIDHLTAFNILGFHGTIQLGQAKNAIVTNSIFANSQLFGDHTFNVEQTQPEKSFFMVTLDTIYQGGRYELRNNNVFWDQQVLDAWAQIDTVNVPGFANQTLLTAAGTTLEQAFFSEHLALANVCDPPVPFIIAYFANPAASEFPENWCVGWDGGIFPEEIDVSYDTQSRSYTAADRNYPVGDLNAFPQLKLLWEQGSDLTSVNEKVSYRPTILAYPNPVRDVLHLIHEADEVIVYNIMGKVVLTAQNVQSLNVSDLINGIYFLNVRNDNIFITQKIVVNR